MSVCRAIKRYFGLVITVLIGVMVSIAGFSLLLNVNEPALAVVKACAPLGGFAVAMFLTGGLTVYLIAQRRAAKAMEEQLGFLQTLVDTIPSPIFYKDVNGIYLGCNAAFEGYLGLPKSQIRGKTVYDVAPCELADVYWRADLALFEALGDQKYEGAVRYADGSLHDVLFTKKTFTDLSGNLAGLVGVMVDITERTRAEKTLENSEARLRQIIDLVPHGIFVKDWDGNYLLVNRTVAERYNTTVGELTGKGQAIFHRNEQEFQQMLRDDREVMSSGKNRFIPEEPFTDWKNKLQFFQTTKVPFYTSGENSPAVLGICIDITEQRLAAVALKESKERLSQILDFLPDPTFAIDLDGKVIVWNRAYEEMTGIKAQDILGKGDYEYSLPFYGYRRPVLIDAVMGRYGELLEKYSHVKRDGDILLAETVAPLKDRQNRFFSCKARPLYDSTGDIIGAIESIRDVTEVKKTEEMLRDSERRYRSVVENIQDVFYRTDSDGVITMISPSASRIYGASRDEILGMHIDQFWSYPDERGKMLEKIRRDGVVRDYEITIRRKDGSSFPASVTSTFMKDDLGAFAGVEGVLRDITERKQAEEDRAQLQAQLTQALKMESVGRLAGGVAHDFNNMLGVILGHAEMAMEKLDQAHAVFADMVEIRKAALRSSELTRQLLAFARKQTISPKTLDLNQTVEGMLKMLRRLIGEDIDLAWLPAKALWPVKVDPGQVDQILANLCVNARDAISGVGKVTIETGKAVFENDYCVTHPEFVAGEFVLLAVSDDGAGMDKKTLSNIFEPFFTTKALGEGTGLGLATVYGIVRQNNGFINVYSEPAKGTTFKIYLPRADENKNVKIKPLIKKELRGRETVLLVEDEESMLALARTILERHGYEVLATKSPSDALTLVHGYPNAIHLLVTDVVMPEMNGKDLAQRLKEIKPGFKTIFMSGYTANVIAHHGILDETINFLQKPFSVNALLEKVRDVLEG
ncbi:MAG: PAS domain S-box protein [Syntrophobacteraceae bacterium]|nr:PAS domain S-box protein [Syntrophobacteraceae bacterium]